MSRRCQVAASRTYNELRQHGQSDGDAYLAAVAVFRSHHPEVARIEALQTVADWLDEAEAAALPASTPR